MESVRHMKWAFYTLSFLALILTLSAVVFYHSSHPQGIGATTSFLPQHNDSRLFHIVTNFVQLNSKELRKNLYLGGGSPTDQQIEARMAEIIECLQRNLNNSMIANVHVLVFGEESIIYLKSLKLENSHKMIVHKNDRWPTIFDQLMYASNHLQEKVVIMSHQDNYIGEGWEKVNPTVLKRKRLMYALTRHPSPSKCKGTMAMANCGEGFPYIGSHDTFVFYVNGPLDHHRLSELHITPNLYGMENILLWVFKTKLNYRILNPCKVLVVYHKHCIEIRERGRKRINVGKRSALAPYTDLLQ